MSQVSAHQDEQQNFSILGVQGHLGAADTKGTAPTLPIGVEPSTGAMYTYEMGEAIRVLQALASAMTEVGGRSLRVTVLTAPSTAVTGPITNAQFVATYAIAGVNYTSRTAMENLAAINSNINNVVITV